MKTSWITWAFVASTVVFGFFFAKKNWECTHLTFLNTLQNRQLDLMRDECREYQFKLATNPTYDDGYKFALLKRSNGSYSDGYEDAKLVFDGSNNYASGYHAAIAQFNFLKSVNKDTAAIIDPAQPITDKKEEGKTY